MISRKSTVDIVSFCVKGESVRYAKIVSKGKAGFAHMKLSDQDVCRPVAKDTNVKHECIFIIIGFKRELCLRL